MCQKIQLCHLVSNNIALDLSRQRLGTKTAHAFTYKPVHAAGTHKNALHVSTHKHTGREHEHATHPQDVRK